MARLRLFAQARDAAGIPSSEFDAGTLGALLDQARETFGVEFSRVLSTARVWVNGDDPEDGDATPLHPDDEVAVLPPVSGG